MAHDNAKNESANIICGFDKWYDNHFGFGGDNRSLDEFRAAFEARGWHYWHAWGGLNQNTSHPGPQNVYVVDPTGDAVQIDSAWEHGPPPGVAGDALQSQCSQGNCKAASRPTPPACSAALAKACPALGLKYNRCADCVYGAAAWHAIKAAGCLNADAVAYCVGE